MKRFFPPLAVLAAILALSLWNARVMEGQTSHLRSQLLQVQKLAAAENWQGAEDALADSYADWTSRQTYLHIVTEHDAVDDAEAMYRRAMAFALEQESSEFRAELADLQDQLRLLAEMERFSLKNVL